MTGPVEQEWYGPLPGNVEFGDWSTLFSSYAFVHCASEVPCAVRVGHHTGIYWGTFFDLGPNGSVEIGDYCTLASPIISTNGRVVIGSHCLMGWGTVVSDGPAPVPPGAGRPFEEDVPEIAIGDNVWLGARSAILPGARLGEGVVVGAAAVVDFEVEPYAVVAGNPARVVGRRPPRDAS